ncbi:OsmC family protein [Candidatus Bipolaricaulota bacterium]
MSRPGRGMNPWRPGLRSASHCYDGFASERKGRYKQMEVHVAFPGDRAIEGDNEAFVLRTDKMVLWCSQVPFPNPLNLVLSSLGMCSGGELQAFCEARNLPTKDVGLRLSAGVDEESRRVPEIRVEVLLPSSFPEQYVEPCQRAVAHCNVKRHLEEPLKVSVSTQRFGADRFDG